MPGPCRTLSEDTITSAWGVEIEMGDAGAILNSGEDVGIGVDVLFFRKVN